MSGDSSEHRPAKPEQGSPQRSPQIHWGSTTAVLYTIFLYFGAQFFAGLTLAAIVAIAGPSFDIQQGGQQAMAGQFYFVLISDAIMLLALWLFLRLRQNGFRQLGFSRKP